MKSAIISALTMFCALSPLAIAQVPVRTAVRILKAEDARRFDPDLEGLMRSPDPKVRERAALAAGRIGDDSALPILASLLKNDASVDVQAMAAFALGEIESIGAADVILDALRHSDSQDQALDIKARIAARRGRLIEAAGKIAAANPNDPRSTELGRAVLETLNAEFERKKPQDTPTVRLGLTAVLRARPDGADKVVKKFLTNLDGRVRGDAANTMARLKSKDAADTLRKMVTDDPDPIARANAARALGTMTDKDSLNELLSAAIEDKDQRVRVSAIGALANVNDKRAARHLVNRGNALTKEAARSTFRIAPQKNELLVIATALGRLLARSADAGALDLLNALGKLGNDSETQAALARIAPDEYLDRPAPLNGYHDFRAAVAYAQGLAALAELKDEKLNAQAGQRLTDFISGMVKGAGPAARPEMLKAMPDLMRTAAALKTDKLNDMLLAQLSSDDVFIRAAAAELLADRPYSDENVDALNAELDRALKDDVQYNDAILATLDALFKLDKQSARGSVTAFIAATNSPDQLVREKALTILRNDAYKKRAELQEFLRSATEKHATDVRRYSGKGTKMGQVLNTDGDYRRALSRRNGTVKAVLVTEKGTFTIDLFPEDAPLTVDNFVRLARTGYFNGLEVHRVVPNFVMQDGDPRGDGNGGPGWTIRCEINMLPYDRGAVGMALSGKDTGGSQWFVTHSPQPHLDGGYTVFGRVNETDMKVVDSIARGDRILSAKIIGK